jgi:hypothetical protein
MVDTWGGGVIERILRARGRLNRRRESLKSGFGREITRRNNTSVAITHAWTFNACSIKAKVALQTKTIVNAPCSNISLSSIIKKGKN